MSNIKGMQYNDIIQKLESLANPEAVKDMARFGINPENTYGVFMPALPACAKASAKASRPVLY